MESAEIEKELCLEMFGDSPDTHVLNKRVTKLIEYRLAIRQDEAQKAAERAVAWYKETTGTMIQRSREEDMASLRLAITQGTGPKGAECPDCNGTGYEICDNPDHGFINAVGGEIGRLGCPCCGHDEQHRIFSSPCVKCGGTGVLVQDQPDPRDEPRLMNEGEYCKNTACEFYDPDLDDKCDAESNGEGASATCLRWQSPMTDPRDALIDKVGHNLISVLRVIKTTDVIREVFTEDELTILDQALAALEAAK